MTRTLSRTTTLLDAERVAALATAQKGRFFSLTFVKRDGSIRKMVCRLGVNSKLVGGGEHTGLGKPGILTVYDVRAQGYRSVRLDSIMTMRAGGTSYTVCQPVAVAAAA